MILDESKSKPDRGHGMNEHAFLLPLKIGSIFTPLASQEDQHLTLAISSADSCVGCVM